MVCGYYGRGPTRGRKGEEDGCGRLLSTGDDVVHRSGIGPLPDYPQTTVDKVASVFEFRLYLIDCVCVGKYYHFSPHPPLSPLVLISKKFAVRNPK